MGLKLALVPTKPGFGVKAVVKCNGKGCLCAQFLGQCTEELELRPLGVVLLQAYSQTHAFAQLSGSDNIIGFTSVRYRAQPLFVRGPGAGAEVTAAGVFSDLILLARSLGARC